MALFDFSPDIVGYSLVRFSTKAQATGDSYRRQVAAAEAFCREEGVPLDVSLHETDIRKLGMSAFKGNHVIKGPIRKFLAGIENGLVKPGKSLLLVSEWNRLTRQISSDALKLTLDLMERGIGIIDLQDRAYYTLDRYNTDVGLQLSLQLKISMAHQYSKNIQHNLRAAWEGKREAMVAGRGKPTKASPAWLTVRKDGTWNAVERPREPTKDDPRTNELWAIPVDERTRNAFRAIERIKADRLLGLGKHAIATRLNTIDPVPAFRGKNGWHPSAVEKLVRNEALRGVLQSYVKVATEGETNREKVGDPVIGFYPRVLSDDDWYRMQWPVNERQARGRRTEGKLSNLFAELFKCSCGGGLVRDNKGHKWGAYLVCSKSRHGMCEHKNRHDLAVLESEMLMLLSLFDVSRLVEKANPNADRIAGLEAEIAAKQKIIDDMAEGFAGNAPPAFFKRMQTIQAEIDEAKGRLTELNRNTRIAEANRSRDSHAEFRAMVAGMADLESDELYQVRKKLDLEIHRLIAGGEAAGDELRIRLRGMPEELQIELLLVEARFIELRLVVPVNPFWAKDEHCDFLAITREQIFDNPSVRAMLFENADPTGAFEAFINRNRQHVA
jgi:DNA invertase Pin-like site-specific DNA recombinase